MFYNFLTASPLCFDFSFSNLFWFRFQELLADAWEYNSPSKLSQSLGGIELLCRLNTAVIIVWSYVCLHVKVV